MNESKMSNKFFWIFNFFCHLFCFVVCFFPKKKNNSNDKKWIQISSGHSNFFLALAFVLVLISFSSFTLDPLFPILWTAFFLFLEKDNNQYRIELKFLSIFHIIYSICTDECTYASFVLNFHCMIILDSFILMLHAHF